MKFRLKVGPYYGTLNPLFCSNGRTYGMQMVPWIKTARDQLGTGLKETKSLADYLRASIETNGAQFGGASVVVDTVRFPFLKTVRLPLLPNDVIDFIDERGEFEPPVTCIDVTGMFVNHSTEVIKEALLKLINMHSWAEARRICEVLEDLDITQAEKMPSGPFASAQ